MNKNIIDNYARLKPGLLLLPLSILFSIALILYVKNACNASAYIAIQKDYFFYLNAALSEYPNIQYNLTQMGDALIFLSFMSIFIIYAPAIWESLISVSLISLVISSTLKNIFAVPRPAAVFDHNSFHIIGRALPGHSSLPSGHSITVFTVITVLLFAFMPQKNLHRAGWIFLLIGSGLVLAFTRVAVGAHYPLDVLVGSTLGYFSGLAGIFISRKYPIWSWVRNRKSYPIFILLLMICGISMVNKIINESLPIFYLTLAVLVISIYKIIHAYIKK